MTQNNPESVPVETLTEDQATALSDKLESLDLASDDLRQANDTFQAIEGDPSSVILNLDLPHQLREMVGGIEEYFLRPDFIRSGNVATWTAVDQLAKAAMTIDQLSDVTHRMTIIGSFETEVSFNHLRIKVEARRAIEMILWLYTMVTIEADELKKDTNPGVES